MDDSFPHIEDTGYSYRFLRDIAGKKPKFRMTDGAPLITKAGEEVVISLIKVYSNLRRLWFSHDVMGTRI